MVWVFINSILYMEIFFNNLIVYVRVLLFYKISWLSIVKRIFFRVRCLLIIVIFKCFLNMFVNIKIFIEGLNYYMILFN